jgi:hypothetical protein
MSSPAVTMDGSVDLTVEEEGTNRARSVSVEAVSSAVEHAPS